MTQAIQDNGVYAPQAIVADAHIQGTGSMWIDVFAVAVVFIAIAALVVVLMRGER